MYFTESQVKDLFNMVTSNFKKCTLICELMSIFMQKNQSIHDTVKKENAGFNWGLKTCSDFTKLCPQFKYIDEWNLTDEMKPYSPIFITFISPILRKRNNKIAQFQYN